MPRIELTTHLAAAPEQAFALSLSVDAHRASMAQSGERIVDGVRSGIMGLGDTVTWQAKHFGIPFRMSSAIVEFDSPHRFVDEQTSGPFRSWWHEHCFEPEGDGTLMRDVVEFESPAGVLGRAVDRLVLTGYLIRLLEQRNVWLERELAG